MKTVHDLKNPISSIGSIVNDNDYDLKEIREKTNHEIEDLNEMLDNLRYEFKQSKGMSLDEAIREVSTKELLDCIKRSQKLLAKNGKNKLIIESHQNCPSIIAVKQLSLKRVINNLMSNALKHTRNGRINM